MMVGRPYGHLKKRISSLMKEAPVLLGRHPCSCPCLHCRSREFAIVQRKPHRWSLGLIMRILSDETKHQTLSSAYDELTNLKL